MTNEEVIQLVKEIQQVMSVTSAPAEEELIDLANRHEEIVDAVSSRLHDVEALLNKGLRPEAIALSEQEPNLNDLVTTLDFPEFEIWNEFLQQYGIQAVPEVPFDIAADLNDAYSVSEPLQRLLERYRTQSLACAPLNERIQTLKELAAEDQENTRWRSDLAEFETHQLGLLQKELQTVSKQQDLERAAAIDREINKTHWSVSVPNSLARSARKVHSQLRKHSARHELEGLCEELSDAFSAFDKGQGRRLQSRFFVLAEILDLEPTDPAYDIAGPALDWLNDEEAKEIASAELEQATAQLEEALQRDTTIKELNEIYDRAVRRGQKLPEMLERRLADRIKMIRDREERIGKAVRWGIIGACGALVAVVVVIVQIVSFHNALEEHTVQAQALLEDCVASGDFQPIDDYLAHVGSDDPDFLLEPVLLGIQEETDLAKRKEDGRRDQFDELISSALQQISGDVHWDAFPAARKNLQEADALALNAAEKARVVNTRTEIQQVQTKLQARTDESFSKDHDELVASIDALPKDNVDGYRAVQDTIANLERRPHVSANLKTALNALRSKVRQQQSMIQANLDMARDLERVTSSVGMLASYRQALMDYVKSHPGTARSADFDKVINSDSPLWKGVKTWNSLRRRFAVFSLVNVDLNEAVELKKAWDTFLKTSGPYPGETISSEQIAALNAIVARAESGQGPSLAQIDRLFAPRTVSQAYLVETADGEKYFATDAPLVTASNVSFSYFTTNTGTQTEEKSLGRQKILGDPERSVERWLSPQAKMSRVLLPELKERMETDFEEAIAYGVETVAKARDVDPILKYLLVSRLLQIGSDGSLFVKNRVDGHLEQIEGVGVSRLTNWAAPGDSRARNERTLARHYIEANTNTIVRDLKSAIEDRTKQADEPIGPAMECIGWLQRDAQGDWIVTLPKDLNVTGKVSLEALGHVQGTPKFYPVASVSKKATGSIPAESIGSEPGTEGNLVYRTISNRAISRVSGSSRAVTTARTRDKSR